MRKAMLSVTDAQSTILADVKKLPSHRISLLSSLNSVLGENVYADIDNPPFDNSAVDGFALRAADTESASESSPVHLILLETIGAGAVPSKHVLEGQCTKIMTGAPVPPGADSITMVEDSSEAGSIVQIRLPAKCGDHVRKAGADVKRGDLVMPADSTVRAGEAAMLAAMGKETVVVYRRPKVAILTTGDEIVEISKLPGAGQIRDSNSYALAAMVMEAGAEIHSVYHAPDDERAIECALNAASGKDGSGAADIIVTSGGVSVGDRDFVRTVLEKLGRLDFWRVNLKPGKPIAVGQIADSLFFGLPGNPVSTMVTFELFVRPVIRKMAGHTLVHRPAVQVRLDSGFDRHSGREEYVRARVFVTESGFDAAPTGAQGSGILSSMLGANALLVLPPESTRFEAGDSVRALLLDMPDAESSAAR